MTARARKARGRSNPRPDLARRARQALRPPEKIKVSEWAERNRYLDAKNNAEPGPWRNARTPYLVEIMDAFCDPEVEQIVLMSAAQVGKTETIFNCLGYSIDQNPGPALIVYPTEKDSDKVIKNRVHPMVQASPAVLGHLLGGTDALGLKEMHFDRCTIYAAWSNSPAALANSPIRNVFLDEVGKFPRYSGAESSPVKLATARTTTFVGRRKIMIVSTPTVPTDELCRAYDVCSARYHYHVPCPFCGEFQELKFFGGVKWPESASPDDIAENLLAWYICAHCSRQIDERQKAPMVAKGRWVQKGCKIEPDGTIIGERLTRRKVAFQLSGLLSPWVSFSKLAAQYLEAKGDQPSMMEFWNQGLGLPFREKHERITDKRLSARVKNYKPGKVPPGAQVLTCGIDVQKDHFWYALRAWGANERSWLIRHGALLTWDDIRQLLFTAYPHEVGAGRIRVLRALIDSGDGHRTEEIYRFCKRHYPIVWPSKGSAAPSLLSPWKISAPPKTGVGVKLVTVKVNHWKDRLNTLINAKDGEAGDWRLHKDTGPDYMRQMTSEHKILAKRGGFSVPTWVPVTDGAPNHIWDAEVLNVVAADMVGVPYLEDGGSAEHPQEEREARREPGRGPERGGSGAWVDGRGWWG